MYIRYAYDHFDRLHWVVLFLVSEAQSFSFLVMANLAGRVIVKITIRTRKHYIRTDVSNFNGHLLIYLFKRGFLE